MGFHLLLFLCLGWLCRAQFPFLMEEMGERDLFVLSNKEVLVFTSNNTLTSLPKDSASVISRITQQRGEVLLNSEIWEESIDRISESVQPGDLIEMCIINETKMLSVKGFHSKCQFSRKPLESLNLTEPSEVSFYRSPKTDKTSFFSNCTLSTDFSLKAIRLPRPVLSLLLSHLNRSHLTCNISHNMLHCSNLSSRDISNNHISIQVNKLEIELSFHDLLKECSSLKECSFWVSPSIDEKISVGSVIMRKYSVRFDYGKLYLEEAARGDEVDMLQLKCGLFLLFVLALLWARESPGWNECKQVVPQHLNDMCY